jgi:hypothetical protein
MQPVLSSRSAGDCLLLQVLLYQIAALCLYNFILILLYWYISPASLAFTQDSHLQRVTITEAAYIHFRRKPAEDERILMNVLYVNKQEFWHQVGDQPRLLLFMSTATLKPIRLECYLPRLTPTK